MKVELDNITIGKSPLTDDIFVGVPNKPKTMWLHKRNITNEFLDCVIKRWEGQSETIVSGDREWKITVEKIK